LAVSPTLHIYPSVLHSVSPTIPTGAHKGA
jgi:hypothetical protein